MRRIDQQLLRQMAREAFHISRMLWARDRKEAVLAAIWEQYEAPSTGQLIRDTSDAAPLLDWQQVVPQRQQGDRYALCPFGRYWYWELRDCWLSLWINVAVVVIAQLQNWRWHLLVSRIFDGRVRPLWPGGIPPADRAAEMPEPPLP
jgi:hypothetical protein